MKKLSLAILLCLSGTALAQPTTGSDEPTAVPVEAGSAAAAGSADKSPGPGKTDEVIAGPTHVEKHVEEKHEGSGGLEPEHEANVDNSQYMNWSDIHYGGKDYYGGTYGDGKQDFVDNFGKTVHTETDEEKMSPPFIFFLINFALLLFVLAKYMRPAGHKLAEERHDLIKSALDEAARLRKAAEDKLAEYETKLKAADAEIATMVAGMKADAEADKARRIAAADAQAAAMKRDAELRIAAEIELARATLTREVTAAAAAATEKILRTQFTDADQGKLVGNFIADMGNASTTQKGARS